MAFFCSSVLVMVANQLMQALGYAVDARTTLSLKPWEFGFRADAQLGQPELARAGHPSKLWGIL